VAAAALALSSASAAEPSAPSAVDAANGSPAQIALADYRALSERQSRNYDRAQDVSPRQLLILLDVAERAQASLGQAIATGEMESAYTWNDHVRPTLKNGSLGSATGVWQFLPATFHGIIKKFGAQLLAASEADALTGRERMDLGDGPFADAQVRGIIAETADGKRGAEDEELQLLRHNFAVLAFAKHYLSLDTGATTPEEDYLYHFLGAGQGRRVLALARGAARDTLCVKPVEVPTPTLEEQPDLLAPDDLLATMRAEAARLTLPPAAAEPAFGSRIAPSAAPPGASTLARSTTRTRAVLIPGRAGLSPAGSRMGGRDARTPRRQADPTRAPRVLPDPMIRVDPLTWSQTRPDPAASDSAAAMMRAEAALRAMRAFAAEPAPAFPQLPPTPPPVSSQWGLPANSATVTGNLGMFYRDGKGQAQPYTWAGFLENLARRVRAKDQPALVRAKYGVGFGLKGGDLPERAFNPQQVSEPTEFRHDNGRTVVLPEALVTGPLGADETRQYRQRLAALVSQGEDQPLATLPPSARAALQHLRVLPPNLQEVSTSHPQVQKALHDFRKQAGKAEPDDPAHRNLLMPAERIALEIYDQRLSHYDQLQSGQLASRAAAPDLTRIRKMPAGPQRWAAPQIAAVQTALAAQGLLTAPTQKVVRRDKKRRTHVEYKTIAFAGKADKTTITALNSFQLRNGLRKTDGVLDAVTLNLLGLPPLGPEIFLPLSGPHCAFNGWTQTASLCETLSAGQADDDGPQIPRRVSRPRPLVY
jgi:hypothetical protein